MTETENLQNELVFIPLGGTGEIGMNFNLYGYKERWLLIDLGITFGDDSTPGIDVMMPDTTFIEERADDIEALLLTHAHEDHLGAVAHLWPKLRCPVYATPFTASILRRKLEDVGLASEVTINIIPMDSKIDIGPFSLDLVTLTHSIPEQSGVLIQVDDTRVFHSGDWKFDADPMVGDATNIKKLAEIGEQGVDALVCDSTNALVPGTSGSEGTVRKNLLEFVKGLKGRVAIASFASNIARLETIAKVGELTGRKVALAGRSLLRMNEAARECGYMKNIAAFISPDEARDLPDDQVLYACTGSQGEQRAALSRIASKSHPSIRLSEGDTVIFSSRRIPGNEMSINRVQGRLADLGVDVVTAGYEMHVSGHPAREELKRMYDLVKPRTVIPVHGESIHLHGHKALAESCGLKSILLKNGDVSLITPEGVEKVDQVHAGRFALNGKRLVPLERGLLRGRNRVLEGGLVVVTVAFDRQGMLKEVPQIYGFTFFETTADMHLKEDVAASIEDEIETMSKSVCKNDTIVVDAVKRSTSRSIQYHYGRKPVVEVHIVRG